LDEGTGQKQFGLIAEDVEIVQPVLADYDYVDGEKKELYGVYYQKLYAPIIKLLQEQQKDINGLKTEDKDVEIEELKELVGFVIRENEELKERISQLEK
jgi:hypothetical protein